jgi:hypothetical protein
VRAHRAIGWWLVAIGVSGGVALAKGHPNRSEESRLAAAATVDGVELPAGALATREARWDEARGAYGPSVLSRFRLARPATVCSARLPAGVVVSVRRGLPASADVGDRRVASAAIHLVWTAPRRARIARRQVAAGETVGVECPGGRVTLVAGAAPFRVGALRVDAALWYPGDLGGGRLSVRLRAPAEISKVRVPAGFTATFAPDGTLVTLLGPPTRAVAIADRVCWTWQLGSEIRVDSHGRVTCTDADTAGVRCDPHAAITLHGGSRAGHLASCRLAAPFTRSGRTWKAGATLRLDRLGDPVR